MPLLKALVNLLLLLVLSSCTNLHRVSDFQVSVTLPASLDCYSFNVLTQKETRLPANSKECIEKKLKSVWIDYPNYVLLKRDIQMNCQFNQCKQITGALDELFLQIDSAIKYINKK